MPFNISDPPSRDADFVQWFAESYSPTCPCDDCDRFRLTLELEFGEEFDASTHNINPVNTTTGTHEPCAVCGSSGGTHELSNGGYSCNRCWGVARIAYCGGCDTYYHVPEDADRAWQRGVRSGDNAPCETCVESGAVRSIVCESCDNLWARDDRDISVDGDPDICDECIARHYRGCSGCGVYYRRYVLMRSGSDQVCGECRDEGYERCLPCGGWRRLNTPLYDNSTCGCPSSGIWSYTYQPDTLKFRGKGNLYLGVELEVEARGDTLPSEGARQVAVDRIFYCKSDSSITEGFEVVTHPFTLEWALENAERFTDMLEYLRSHGFESDQTETCGMHVHMSGDAFDDDRLRNFIKLIYDNPSFTLLISERISLSNFERWAGIDREKEDYDDLDSMLLAKTGGADPGERHVAVYVAEHRDTIEVRVFGGTLQWRTFLKNLEFCVAAFEYSGAHKHNNISQDGFVAFVDKHAKRFPSLREFLVKKHIL